MTCPFRVISVDQFLSSSYRETMSDEQQMNALLQHLDRVTELKHGGSRVKWTKALRSVASTTQRPVAGQRNGLCRRRLNGSYDDIHVIVNGLVSSMIQLLKPKSTVHWCLQSCSRVLLSSA